MQNTLQQINKKLHLNLTHSTEINAGMNNKLFKVSDGEGHSYLLKFYLKDERQRLEREFRAFSFLYGLGFRDVPKPYLKNEQDYFAVYSYEEGRSKKATEVSKQDIEQMAQFLARLHSITPAQVTIPMPPAVNPCFSLNGYITNTQFRVQKFTEFAEGKDAPEIIQKLNKKHRFNVLIPKLIRQATFSYTTKQLSAPIKKSKQRLNPLDFGIQNMIFRDDGSICFIDFEYFGFDDQMRLICDFVQHDQSLDLPEEYKTLIIARYINLLKLNDSEQQRLQTVLALTAIEWITIYLYSITPEKVTSRKFANKNFNEELYIQDQVDKINYRLKLNQLL